MDEPKIPKAAPLKIPTEPKTPDAYDDFDKIVNEIALSGYEPKPAIDEEILWLTDRERILPHNPPQKNLVQKVGFLLAGAGVTGFFALATIVMDKPELAKNVYNSAQTGLSELIHRTLNAG